MKKNKINVHLWIFNNPFNRISDQIDFFVMSLRQYGYSVSIGNSPKESALNVVIENFSGPTKSIVENFCQMTQKKVAIIMTEHFDFHGQIFFHGEPLKIESDVHNDYMDSYTQYGRTLNVFQLLPCIRCFLKLGDMPELHNISQMIPGVDVRSIPFPKLKLASNNIVGTDSAIKNDLLFTGLTTEYRTNILSQLKLRGISFADNLSCFVSRHQRNAMNRNAKILLNIPQSKKWAWLSLMRVFAGLNCGRATVSLGTNDSTRISSCCLQHDIDTEGWIDELQNYIANWKKYYIEAYENYMSMAEEYEKEEGFPHDLFDLWSIFENL